MVLYVAAAAAIALCDLRLLTYLSYKKSPEHRFSAAFVSAAIIFLQAAFAVTVIVRSV